MTKRVVSPVLAPGSTLGILGGGQLGRMLALAAAQLGYRVHIYTPEAHAPASMVAASTTVAQWENIHALGDFARGVDAITYEFENIPLETVIALEEQGVSVQPSSRVLAICQHRIREKSALRDAGIPTADFMAITDQASLQAAHAFPFPAILKTAESGYDGKGQAKIASAAELDAAWKQFGHVGCILESLVDFRMEVSVLVTRAADGQIACFDPVHNIHRNHILDETHAPAPISTALAAEARALATRIATEIDLQGLLAVELFVTKDDALLVNELAPRPHNSGHWTMEACHHSQFEQCARAVLGLSLGTPERHSNARMKNLIGDEANDWASYLADPSAKLHLYGKSEARPGRKMGHVTWLLPKSDA